MTSRFSTFVVLLAMVASVACGSIVPDSPTAPTPPVSTPMPVPPAPAPSPAPTPEPSPTPAPAPTVESWTIKGKDFNFQTTALEVGKSAQAEVIVTYRDGSTGAADQVTWTSDNPAVATVSTTGVVTGVAAGNTLIWAEFRGQRGSMGITVKDPPPPPTTMYGGVYYGSPFSAKVVPGVLVEVTSPEECKGLHATTGSNGLYRLEGITCSRFRVRFSRLDLGDKNYDLGRLEGQTSFEFNVLFTPN